MTEHHSVSFEIKPPMLVGTWNALICLQCRCGKRQRFRIKLIHGKVTPSHRSCRECDHDHSTLIRVVKTVLINAKYESTLLAEKN